MPRLTVKQLDEHVLIAEGQIASLLLASDNHYAQIGAVYRNCVSMAQKIETLTQLAQQQADTIQLLSDKLAELAGDHNALAMAVEDIGDEEALSHQWLDRQQQRIVALEKRDSQTFTLSESNAKRAELHGMWIAELFNRLNDHVNNDHV